MKDISVEMVQKKFMDRLFHRVGGTTIGVIFMLVAMFIFVSVNAILKTCEQEYPITQVVFFRFLFAMLPCLILIRSQGNWAELRSKVLPWHIVRGIGGVISLSCLFQSIWLLPFADATVLMFASTLFITGFAGPMLGETVGLKRLVAIAIGFAGIIVIAKPSTDVLHASTLLGIAFGLGSALLEALLMLHNRILTKIEPNATIVFYYALVATLVCAVTLPFVWVAPTPHDWVVLMALGVGGGLAQYLLTVAYSYAPAMILAPMLYSAMIWSVLYGIWFFQEAPAEGFVVGAAMIIGSGLYVTLSKGQKKIALEQ